MSQPRNRTYWVKWHDGTHPDDAAKDGKWHMNGAFGVNARNFAEAAFKAMAQLPDDGELFHLEEFSGAAAE